MDDKLLYKIALSILPGVGGVNARKLIAYAGGIEEVFQVKTGALQKIPGIGKGLANKISGADVIKRAEREVEFVKKHNIKVLFYLDDEYPYRLKNCPDAPLLLFYKGGADLNNPKVISIVGTRKATSYGEIFCQRLMEDLANNNHHPLIVSGLAYGIDIMAHKAALAKNIPTLGVLAHGLGTIYPKVHRKYATQMVANGGLVTDFVSDIWADKPNFARRNRIIAGMADATIVVESGEKGGALITADLANSYSRDVFAVPGKIGDTYSAGCNRLIKTHKAALIESWKDLEYIMGWENTSKQKAIQKQIFVELEGEEKQIYEMLKEKGEMEIDQICLATKIPVPKVSSTLLNLEFEGLIKSLPGRRYKMI